MTDAVESATGGDVLSPAEQAYFESGGSKTDGLVSEAAATEGAPTAQPEPPDDRAKDAATNDDDPALGPDGKPKNPGQWVRHGALHAERERRKKAEAELQGERELRARFDERLKMLGDLSAANAAAARPEEPPAPEKDIFGYVRHLERKLAGVEGQVGETARMAQAQRAEAALKDVYLADARAFLGKTPDFGDAYQHLLRSRDQELAMIGHADPQRRAALIAAEERDLVAHALQRGTSPSEFMYALAKSRGYQGPPPAAAGRNGKAPVTEQIETIARGQAAAKSLSNVGGSAGDAITPEALAGMSDDEFHALFNRLSKAKQREILGG
jgi:hypothetical protein